MCDFCNTRKIPTDVRTKIDNGIKMFISTKQIEPDKNFLFLTHSAQCDYSIFKINYCPICGRKL